MKMNFFLLFGLILLCATGVNAQTIKVNVNESETVGADTVRVSPRLDSALIGVNPHFYVTNGDKRVEVNKSASVGNAMDEYIVDNAHRKLHGYRIRIFFDNKQSARAESEKIESEFKEAFPEIFVYRTYSNPYFKVAVGDYRTKSDALKGLEKIKALFPNAFIIRESINYPQL